MSKYQPRIDKISTIEWNVASLLGLIVGARSNAHIPTLRALQQLYKIKKTTIFNMLVN